MGRAGPGFRLPLTQPYGLGPKLYRGLTQPWNPSGWVGFSPRAILGADSVGLSRLLSQSASKTTFFAPKTAYLGVKKIVLETVYDNNRDKPTLSALRIAHVGSPAQPDGF